MSRLDKVIDTLEQTDFNHDSVNLYLDEIYEAIKYLKAHRCNILNNRHAEGVIVAPSPTFERPPRVNSGIPAKAVKKVTSVKMVLDLSESKLEEKIMAACNTMQDNGEEVEIQFQKGEGNNRVLIIGRK